MSDQTSTLTIKLLAQGQFEELKKARENLDNLRLGAELAKLALEGIGVGLSLEGVKSLAEYGASIQHLSEQAGISTEAFQKLAYVSIDAGVNQDELSSALNVLQRNLAQAADGATKQSKAIAELGLNTTELLAMPVEQQIQAIARAYINSTDKGKAWADVVDLLGRNSARLKEVLQDIGVNGLAAANGMRIVSDADIERLDKAERSLAKIGMTLKSFGAGVMADIARAADAVNNFQFSGSKQDEQDTFRARLSNLHDSSMAANAPKAETTEQHAAKMAAIEAENEAKIQGSDQMIAARQALARAILDEGKAYETASEAAARLNQEAAEAMTTSNDLALNKGNAADQLKSVQLWTEAARLVGQANEAETRAGKEKAQYDAAEAEMAQRMAQQATAMLPVNQQLATAKQHELDLETRLAGLDSTSLTFRQDHLKTEEEILTVKGQISALEEKSAAASVEQAVKAQEQQNKRAAIAIAAIEHDANKSDTEKWQEKHDILEKTLAEQDQYIKNMQAIADDPSAPQGARDKAGQAAEAGRTAKQSTFEGLGAMGADPHSFTQNFSADLKKLQSQWGTLQQSMASGLTGVISKGWSSVSNEITKAIQGAETFGQAVRNIAVDIEQSLIQAIVNMGVEWIAGVTTRLLLGEVAKQTDTKTTEEAANEAGMLWATPAALASVASFGAADIAGMSGLTAAVLEAQGFAAGGFASGGFTGGMEGQAAGIVHGQEFVWSAPAVRAVGAGNLERAHQAALSGGGTSSPSRSGGGGKTPVIVAMSPEDVARSQRKYVGAEVARTGRKSAAAGLRVAL